MLSVVIPIKDEQDNLFPLYCRLCDSLDPLATPYEIVFVDDGSLDRSFAQMSALAADDRRVKVVRLRRNFGQTAAMLAGFDHATGDVLVTMDGDLQNEPRDIPNLLKKLDEGYDIVLGQRVNRRDSFIVRTLPSRLANWLIRKVTRVPFRDFGCTLRAMRREVADLLPLYGEMHRFVPALAQHGGARLAQIPVHHNPRIAGRTKYGISRSVRVLLDLMTVQFLNRYVARPMHLFGTVGLLLMFLGLMSFSATVAMRVFQDVHMSRNPLLLLSVMLELCGVQLLSTGLLGELLARTYFESQNKSPYQVRETRNLQPASVNNSIAA